MVNMRLESQVLAALSISIRMSWKVPIYYINAAVMILNHTILYATNFLNTEYTCYKNNNLNLELEFLAKSTFHLVFQPQSFMDKRNFLALNIYFTANLTSLYNKIPSLYNFKYQISQGMSSLSLLDPKNLGNAVIKIELNNFCHWVIFDLFYK